MNILFLNGFGFDYLSSQICEGIHLLSKTSDVKFKCLQVLTHHGAQVHDLPETPVEEALDNVGWADLVLFSSAGNMLNNHESVHNLMDGDSISNKRVFIDGHDGDGFLVDPDKQLVYFKRELRHPTCNDIAYSNVRGLTFGVYNYLMEGLEWHKPVDQNWDSRDVDISFMAYGGSHGSRGEVKYILDQLSSKLGWSVQCHVSSDSQPIPMDEYHSILARSKIGVSLMGAGLDTLRYWETPAHGAVLLSYNIGSFLQMRNAFEHQRHCVYFSNWEQMVESAVGIVNSKDRWCQIRRAADERIKLHSTIARARELLDVCLEMI